MLALLGVAALASSLVAVATKGADRWGHGIGGVLSAFPLIVGPVLLLAAHQHGAAFAARAAAATLLGLVSVAAFSLAYARCAQRRSWPLSLLIAWAAAAAVGVAAGNVDVDLAGAALVAGVAILIARVGVPGASRTSLMTVTAPDWELPVRMAVTAALIVLISLAAERFGPVVAGLLASLPILASVMAVFTHRTHGSEALVDLLRGMLAGLTAFAAFCAIVGALVDRLDVVSTFALATAAAIGVQIAISRRHARPVVA